MRLSWPLDTAHRKQMLKIFPAPHNSRENGTDGPVSAALWIDLLEPTDAKIAEAAAGSGQCVGTISAAPGQDRIVHHPSGGTRGRLAWLHAVPGARPINQCRQ